jgi:hypothetical protein
MITHVLEYLLTRLQYIDLVEQPQAKDIFQLLCVHQEPTEDVEVRLMALAPRLERTQIVKEAESERLF